MFKKLLVVTAVVVALALGGGVKVMAHHHDLPFASATEVEVGVFSSYKELIEVQWVEYDGDYTEFVMIEDMFRVKERQRNNPNSMPMQIAGIHKGLGVYTLYMRTFFGVYPIGVVKWSDMTSATALKSWKILGDHLPVMFQTVVGYEDIYAYFEFSDEDMESIKSMVRRLNTENLKQYEGK